MKECVIWTVNIDSRKKRSEGRKIALKYAVPNVKLEEIVKACKELGIPCKAEEKKYPKFWWEEGGRVVVPKTESKIRLMEKIVSKIKEIREREKTKKKK
ncbi:signal recognition particle subunit SRP19/SEC65 family protein [Archaeoglobus profundus]|uniref:Signal recognition particle 19 kDa protein n=1 Tax=Archaeoglobus profundus (strain DSM 5631 / JCM 9629 / NBRC 100127 / Av18) TaxID=572546 RepID=D2RE05_ARCPA|nr:signal recognition particle subunit SRP19/SEC65 family protein [Archaeoglobus profundus]ADB58349.1 Ribonucleoprotein complex SRP, Srp19 component [Archaeoglobus profundus DSM 5631]